jgi:hypothetical protein
MGRPKKATVVLVLFAAISVLAGPAFAGLLDTGQAYTEGTRTWQGNTLFDNGEGLTGSVDWAVFGPGVFPFGGYSPTDSYTYVYQIHATGVAVSQFSVALEGRANGLGWFSDEAHGVTGDLPTEDSWIYDPPEGSANWFFGGILGGSSSRGLVFSSPSPPMDYYSLAVDHGTVANYIDVASPIPVPIPEPATIWLLACALGTTLAVRRLRRR